MSSMRAIAGVLCAAAAIALAGCIDAPQRSQQTANSAASGSWPAPIPAPAILPQSVADAVPRIEPRSRHGNPAFYDVLGKRYYVLSSSSAYLERGVASWYGPGFHKVRTSTGEPYDMYGMTAAHKTLPLPAYVRVTNLLNGRSIVVRVNDRGPFVANRIIDLSYTAAAKLDMLRNGTAMVEVRALDPAAAGGASAAGTPGAGDTATVTTVAVNGATLFVQAGAFADPANAERLAAKLRAGGYGKVFVRDNQIAGRRMYRVRIGPVPDVAEFDRIVAALQREGVSDARLALD